MFFLLVGILFFNPVKAMDKEDLIAQIKQIQKNRDVDLQNKGVLKGNRDVILNSMENIKADIQRYDTDLQKNEQKVQEVDNMSKKLKGDFTSKQESMAKETASMKSAREEIEKMKKTIEVFEQNIKTHAQNIKDLETYNKGIVESMSKSDANMQLLMQNRQGLEQKKAAKTADLAREQAKAADYDRQIQGVEQNIKKTEELLIKYKKALENEM